LPELPEVETTRRHLDAAMTGRTLVEVSVDHPRTARLNASPEEVAVRLTGRSVMSMGRHGKFLTAPLDDGQTMISHLGMSGRFSLSGGTDPSVPHTHVVMVLDDGQEVRFVDPRTFGFVSVFDEDDIGLSPLSRLGPDAWQDPPTAAGLRTSLRGRTAPIKALLLDQGIVAGLGNIYADEVLHLARVHPLRAGGRISAATASRILDAIRHVLGVAIDSGGTTLEDLAYLLPDGQAGENLESLEVYGREGLPCRRCGTPVRRIVVRARSTHYCPSCQR
jgi:formamidopyrimidine-DNA glycosylase